MEREGRVGTRRGLRKRRGKERDCAVLKIPKNML